MRLYSYAASANCLKVRQLLRILERPYEHVEVDIFAGDTLTDAYARLNPLRETPVLELDDGTPLTQSNAILGYLADGTPWAASDRLEGAQIAAWLVFEQERVMGGIGGPRFRLITGRAGAERLAGRVAVGRGALDVLQARLAERPWLVGAGPTIADVSVAAYTSVAGDVGLDLAGWPAVAAWLDRLRAVPGFVDDLEPYPPNARPDAGRSIYDPAPAL